MNYRILFVASLHHPAQLEAAVRQTPSGQPQPLFPPSVSQHFWERTLRRRGCEMDIFYRNAPSLGGAIRAQRHQEGLSAGKLAAALARRIPPRANPDLRWRNQQLQEKVRQFQPDVLWMVGDNTVIYPETLERIKHDSGCRIIYATGTSPIVFSRPIERQAASLYDLVLVNDYYHGIQWLELGAPRMECLPISACDPDFHRPYELTPEEQQQYCCDVAFVGTLIPGNLYSRRVEALEALTEFDLGLWSVHDAPASLKRFVRGQALGESMLRVLSAARITINSHGNFMRYGGNMRLFEAAGVGVLQMTDDLPGVREWFTIGENIVTYHDQADLRDKVAYYLAHESERTAVARQGREHVYQNHTYEQRVDRLEELLREL